MLQLGLRRHGGLAASLPPGQSPRRHPHLRPLRRQPRQDGGCGTEHLQVFSTWRGPVVQGLRKVMVVINLNLARHVGITGTISHNSDLRKANV